MANNCIWAILSIGELGFVNTSSIYDSQLLKGRSLYQLIHPEEVALAKRDLSIFMNSNMIGGSVTR
jgi:isopropylmalate/homocitrate/citramalate synthase